jgi:hypothetical protein
MLGGVVHLAGTPEGVAGLGLREFSFRGRTQIMTSAGAGRPIGLVPCEAHLRLEERRNERSEIVYPEISGRNLRPPRV